MKKSILVLLLTGILLSASVGIAAADVPTVNIDGTQLYLDVPPVVEKGRTLVPLRAIFEAIGAIVTWDGSQNTVLAVGADKTIQLQIDNKEALVNGTTVLLDVPATTVNGRTMVPVRFVAETMNCTVNWNEATNSVDIQGRTIKVDTTDSLGFRYVGETKYGGNDGYGTVIIPNLLTYEGYWKNGYRNGQGTQVEADGSNYTGEWTENVREGQGTMTYANGDKYVGEWANNIPNGQGTFSWASGYANGDKYVGEFVNGKMNGRGTYYWANGRKYIGTFLNGKPNGSGTFCTSSGLSYPQYYNNGTLVTSSTSTPTYIPTFVPTYVPTYTPTPVVSYPSSTQPTVTSPSDEDRAAALASKIKAIELQYDYDLAVLNRKNEEEKKALIENLISRGFSGYPQAQVDQINAKYDTLREQLLAQKNIDVEEAKAQYQ